MNKYIVLAIAFLIPSFAFASFSHNLSYGMSGSDVFQLQDILTEDGCMTHVSTGYFGLLTLNSVKCYQEKNNLPSTGYVGSMTRAVLNTVVASAVAPSDAEAIEETGTTSPADSSTLKVACPVGFNCIPAYANPNFAPTFGNSVPQVDSTPVPVPIPQVQTPAPTPVVVDPDAGRKIKIHDCSGRGSFMCIVNFSSLNRKNTNPSYIINDTAVFLLGKDIQYTVNSQDYTSDEIGMIKPIITSLNDNGGSFCPREIKNGRADTDIACASEGGKSDIDFNFSVSGINQIPKRTGSIVINITGLNIEGINNPIYIGLPITVTMKFADDGSLIIPESTSVSN